MSERSADAWKAPLPHNRRLGPRRRWWVYWTMRDDTTGAALVDNETMADELVAALGPKQSTGPVKALDT